MNEKLSTKHRLLLALALLCCMAFGIGIVFFVEYSFGPIAERLELEQRGLVPIQGQTEVIEQETPMNPTH